MFKHRLTGFFMNHLIVVDEIEPCLLLKHSLEQKWFEEG
jgi:hypothetical protein